MKSKKKSNFSLSSNQQHSDKARREIVVHGGLGHFLGKGQLWIPVPTPIGWVLDNTELS